MGTNLRLLYDHLGDALAIAATSAAAGFPASNLETGNRHLFWKATSSAEQTLTYDAGTGKTRTCDYVVLPRADLLVAVVASVVVQYSTDMAVWTDAFTALAPIATGDLLQPTGTDYTKEFSSQTKRGWRLRLYGAMTGAPSLAGGWRLGAMTEIASNPAYGRSLGTARPQRGAEVEFSWPPMADAAMETLISALGLVTPGWPAEAPNETIAGAAWGGLPHYLSDPTGVLFRRSGTAWLLPVLCMTPEAALSRALAVNLDEGPTVRWRQRV